MLIEYYKNLGMVKTQAVPKDRTAMHIFLNKEVALEDVRKVLKMLKVNKKVTFAVDEVESDRIKEDTWWIYLEYPKDWKNFTDEFLEKLDETYQEH